jgi:hypothetical protein
MPSVPLSALFRESVGSDSRDSHPNRVFEVLANAMCEKKFWNGESSLIKQLNDAFAAAFFSSRALYEACDQKIR